MTRVILPTDVMEGGFLRRPSENSTREHSTRTRVGSPFCWAFRLQSLPVAFRAFHYCAPRTNALPEPQQG